MFYHTCWLPQSQGCDLQFQWWPHPRKEKKAASSLKECEPPHCRGLVSALTARTQFQHTHTYTCTHTCIITHTHRHAHTHNRQSGTEKEKQQNVQLALDGPVREWHVPGRRGTLVVQEMKSKQRSCPHRCCCSSHASPHPAKSPTGTGLHRGVQRSNQCRAG